MTVGSFHKKSHYLYTKYPKIYFKKLKAETLLALSIVNKKYSNYTLIIAL